MRIKLSEAKTKAVRKLREQLEQQAPQGTTINSIRIQASEEKEKSRTLYNKLTRVQEPCDLVWEHWIVRYRVRFTLRFEITTPDGNTYLVERLSNWYSVEEWDIFTYLDCHGAEDLPPIPEGHCSFEMDGNVVWKGQSATLHNGQFEIGNQLEWLLEIPMDIEDEGTFEPEQRKI